MPRNKSQALTVIQNAVDIIAGATAWEEAAFMKALELGLEGEKRKNRYESAKDDLLRRFLQSVTYDAFETCINPNPVRRVDFAEVTDPEKFFTAYQTFLWDYYEKLHEMANQLVAPLCFRYFAHPLYVRCECLLKEITEVNRRIKRYHNMQGQGTTVYHDLMLYETADENIHDKYEQLEKEIGYDY